MNGLPISLLFSLFLTFVTLISAIVKREFLFVPLILLIFLLQVQVLVRFRLFLRTLSRLIKSLQQDDFSVEMEGVEKDAFIMYLHQLASAIKKTGEFEKLRKARVLLYYRALTVLLRKIKEPVVWIDIEEDFFRLNPSAQTLFGIEQEEYKLSGIMNLPDNNLFASWLNKVVGSEEIVPNEIACDIALPVSKRAQVLYVEAMVVKTMDGKAKIVFLFLKPV